MAEDPFEQARRAMARAEREFHKRMEGAQAELHQALEAGQRRIAEARADFSVKMAQLRAEMRQAGRPPGRWAPPSPRRKPRGGFGPTGKPWSPKPRGPNDGGPQPTPVRPNNPSFLSGGAEAPLDE